MLYQKICQMYLSIALLSSVDNNGSALLCIVKWHSVIDVCIIVAYLASSTSWSSDKDLATSSSSSLALRSALGASSINSPVVILCILSKVSWSNGLMSDALTKTSSMFVELLESSSSLSISLFLFVLVELVLVESPFAVVVLKINWKTYEC